MTPMRTPPDNERAALLLGWLVVALCLAHLLGLVGCGAPAGPVLVAGPGLPPPHYCGRAVTDGGAWEMVCSDSRPRCELALRWARRLRTQLHLGPIEPRCRRMP